MSETSSRRVAEIRNRLSDGVFKLTRDVQLASGETASVVASRTYLSWKGLVVLSQHIVVRVVPSPTRRDLDHLFADGFTLAKARNRVPLLRGMQFGYMIIPVIVAEEITQDLLDLVSRPPRKRWALFEFPALCEAAEGITHYYQGTPLWGAFYFDDLRAVVDKYIGNSRADHLGGGSDQAAPHRSARSAGPG